MLEVIKLIFRFLIGTNKVVEKALPSEKIQEAKFEVTKPTLTESQVKKIADKRNRLADEMFGDLEGHPELSVADKVYYEAKELDETEKQLLIKILTDRLNASPKYNRLKNKKSKFKL
jgi:hypothetical protein